jgi:Fur family transcriptional regulator, ferric uptake regulator
MCCTVLYNQVVMITVNNKLKDSGYRTTTGRKAILDMLTNTEGHLSAEDIYLKVHPIYPSIGLTSVYRTLEILVNVGLVHKFDFKDRKARYELAEGPGGKRHHHHLICTVCHKIIDYADFVDAELALVKQTEEHLSKQYNFKIINHVIQYYGLCEKCNKNDELQHVD